MPVSRGDVRWGPAIHKSSPAYRPWLVVSTGAHPFAAEECIAVALRTVAHGDGIAVHEGDWTEGGSERQPYVSPWYVTTVRNRTFDHQQGRLTPAFVNRVVGALHRYVPVLA